MRRLLFLFVAPVHSFGPLLYQKSSLLKQRSAPLLADYRFGTNGLGIASDRSVETAVQNKDTLNKLFETVKPGDRVIFPEGQTFWMMGGVNCNGKTDLEVVVNGKIKFVGQKSAKKKWPVGKYQANTSLKGPLETFLAALRAAAKANGFFKALGEFVKVVQSSQWYENKVKFGANKPQHCITFNDCYRVKFTSDTQPVGNPPNEPLDFSTSGGIIDGGGDDWWGYVRYALRKEHRPKLVVLNKCKHVVFENIELRKSPYWTFYADQISDLTVQHSKVENLRTQRSPLLRFLLSWYWKKSHSYWQLGAFNTDGFDVKGDNIRVRDVDVMCQDDCVCVKSNSNRGGSIPVSRNITIERVRASGMGLVIGALTGGQQVADVRFQDCVLYDRTMKGIYFKMHERANATSLISNVLCQDIKMIENPKVPIWIGPAQQSDNLELWKGHPASLLWPSVLGFPVGKCPTPPGFFNAITLKNIAITNPDAIPIRGVGVVCADATGIEFDNVRVNMKNIQNAFYYKDDKAKLIDCTAKGNTWPVPPFGPQEIERPAPVVNSTWIASPRTNTSVVA